MGFVNISNGVSSLRVQRGAFDTIFKLQGFFILKENEEAQEEDIQENPDDNYCDLLLEKPISQWDKKEVKTFAAIKSIDISGTKGPSEAKEIVKKYLEENE